MQIINAADYGIPQRRKRVIIVGLKSGENLFFLNLHNENGDGLKKYVSVQDALGDLPAAIDDENGYVTYEIEPQNDYQKRMRSGSGNKVTEHFIPQMSE